MDASSGNTSDAKRVGFNTIFNTAGGIILQLLTFVTGVFVARHFGAEFFGQLMVAATITGYFALVTEFGISKVAIRIVAATGNAERFVSSYLAIRLALSAVSLTVLAGVIYAVDFSTSLVWLLIAYGVTIPLQVGKLNWVFQARQRMFIDNFIQVSEKLAYVFCLFALVFSIESIIAVPIALIASILVGNVLSWVFYLRRADQPISWRLDRKFIKSVTGEGWKIGVAGAAMRSNSNIDALFVNAFRGDIQTGLYGAAYRLVNVVVMAGMFFTKAVYPLSCKRYHESRSSLGEFIGYSSKLLVLVTIPTVVVLAVSAETIIDLILGQEYADAAAPFRLLVCAAGVTVISRLYHNTLLACERQNVFLKIMMISLAVNLVCNVLLIPPFGIMGAAIATILTEICLLILGYASLARVIQLKTRSDILAIAVCTGLSSAVFLLPFHVLAIVPMFVAAYFILLLGSRVLGPREWRLVRVMLGRPTV